eukprot:CFRG1276T1
MQRELDARTQDFFKRVDEETNNGLLKHKPNGSLSTNVAKINELADILETCLSYSVAKERLAAEALNTMGEAVKRLNSDYTQYDYRKKEEQKEERRKRKLIEAATKKPTKKVVVERKKSKPKPPVVKPVESAVKKPKAPEEKKYCICKSVVYEEMVGCDNDDCPYEWFHYGCVGLKEAPKGEWICNHCMQQRQKQQKV